MPCIVMPNQINYSPLKAVAKKVREEKGCMPPAYEINQDFLNTYPKAVKFNLLYKNNHISDFNTFKETIKENFDIFEIDREFEAIKKWLPRIKEEIDFFSKEKSEENLVKFINQIFNYSETDISKICQKWKDDKRKKNIIQYVLNEWPDHKFLETDGLDYIEQRFKQLNDFGDFCKNIYHGNRCAFFRYLKLYVKCNNGDYKPLNKICYLLKCVDNTTYLYTKDEVGTILDAVKRVAKSNWKDLSKLENHKVLYTILKEKFCWHPIKSTDEEYTEYVFRLWKHSRDSAFEKLVEERKELDIDAMLLLVEEEKEKSWLRKAIDISRYVEDQPQLKQKEDEVVNHFIDDFETNPTDIISYFTNIDKIINKHFEERYKKRDSRLQKFFKELEASGYLNKDYRLGYEDYYINKNDYNKLKETWSEFDCDISNLKFHDEDKLRYDKWLILKLFELASDPLFYSQEEANDIISRYDLPDFSESLSGEKITPETIMNVLLKKIQKHGTKHK